MTNNAFRRPTRAVACCAGFFLSAASPAFAQLGQSDFIPLGGADAQTEQIGAQSGASQLPQSTQPSQFTQGLNPGRGWTPPKKFGAGAGMQQPQMAPMQQPQTMSAGGAGGEDFADNSGGWADIQHKTHNGLGISDPNAGGAAFQQQAAGAGQQWALPSAQQGEQWQSGMQPPPAADSQWRPVPNQQAQAPSKPVVRAGGVAAKPGVKPGVKAAAKPHPQQISGHVQQNANTGYPAQQFNPMGGMQMGTAGGGMQMMQPMGAMQGNAGMPAGAMNGMQSMSGMQPMGGMGGGMSSGGMGSMGGIGGGMSSGGMGSMGGMGGGMSSGGMGSMGGMGGGMSSGGMGSMGGMGGGMGAMGALGALMGGGGGGGSPLDAIGRAINGAAQMGLIPGGSSAGGAPNVPQGYDPNTGTYGNPSGASYGGGGGGNYTNTDQVHAGQLTQQRRPSQSLGQKLNKVPGVQTGKQIGKTINRGIARNMNYAVNAAARRGIQRALWGY